MSQENEKKLNEEAAPNAQEASDASKASETDKKVQAESTVEAPEVKESQAAESSSAQASPEPAKEENVKADSPAPEAAKAPETSEEVKDNTEAAKAAEVVETAKGTEAKAAPSSEEDEKEAKRKAAAEARAARAAARAQKEEEAEAAPKPPSPNQPRLDRLVEILKENVHADAVLEAFINELDRDLPVVVIEAAHWNRAAEVLKEHPELKLHYLRNVSGVDYETHLEVVYHLISLETKHDYCIKIKTNHDQPSITSVTSVWSTANWNEREIFDLLGIDFPGHPDMRRIMLPDDWVGHPLRKDYEPLDPEV